MHLAVATALLNPAAEEVIARLGAGTTAHLAARVAEAAVEAAGVVAADMAVDTAAADTGDNAGQMRLHFIVDLTHTCS